MNKNLRSITVTLNYKCKKNLNFIVRRKIYNYDDTITAFNKREKNKDTFKGRTQKTRGASRDKFLTCCCETIGAISLQILLARRGYANISSKPLKDGELPVAFLAGMKLSFEHERFSRLLSRIDDCESTLRVGCSPWVTDNDDDVRQRVPRLGCLRAGMTARASRRRPLYVCVRRRLCVCCPWDRRSPRVFLTLRFVRRPSFLPALSLSSSFLPSRRRDVFRIHVCALDMPMRPRMIHALPNCNSGFGEGKGEEQRDRESFHFLNPLKNKLPVHAVNIRSFRTQTHANAPIWF